MSTEADDGHDIAAPAEVLALSTLRFEVRGRVGTCTFARPERLNSLTGVALDELQLVIDRVRSDSNIGVLILTGSDSVFSVGLDRDDLSQAFAEADYFRELIDRLGKVCLEIEQLEVPVIAAVNGLARAGGFDLALASDFILVAAEAKLGDVHTSFGNVSGAGSSGRLSRAIGIQRAKELMFTARWMTGQEAVEVGLALKCAPRASLTSLVDEFTADLVDKSRPCLATVKAQIGGSIGLSLAAAAELDRELFTEYLNSPQSDAHEGFDAFVEGRLPVWGVRSKSSTKPVVTLD